MKNEWDMFAAVQQRLTAGEQLVTLYFDQRLVHLTDEQRGTVHDDQGNEYELGTDFKQALQTCIRDQRISWGTHFPKRLIRFGPGVTALDDNADYSIGPDAEGSIELIP